jgi:hypothetical protein
MSLIAGELAAAILPTAVKTYQSEHVGMTNNT